MKRDRMNPDKIGSRDIENAKGHTHGSFTALLTAHSVD